MYKRKTNTAKSTISLSMACFTIRREQGMLYFHSTVMVEKSTREENFGNT